MGKKPLDPKAESFCHFFTAIGSETFSRGEKSARAAGYAGAGAGNRATALLRRPAVQARIAELHTQNMARNQITTDKVLSDLENLRILSEDKGDYSTAFRCSEAEAKYLSLFTSRFELVQPDEQREFDAAERAEILALAQVRLTMGLAGPDEAAPVRMIAGESQEQTPSPPNGAGP